jgi:threonine dehydrogenase-like Zn-dependent dehydrogenase
MKALVFDRILQVKEIEQPVPESGEALIRVAKAGICNTDHEIVKGYIPGFSGVLGHEFFGYVEESDYKDLIGKRVTGEINLACGRCDYCRSGLSRHCPERSVLGIMERQGVFAEYVCVPMQNLIQIPDEIPDSSAVFIEPLAAALEILEQVAISREKDVLLIGDGKLAQLIALAMKSTGCGLTVIGKHEKKLGLLRQLQIESSFLDNFQPGKYDVVIEASGNAQGLTRGLKCVKPRGTMVLKSTYAEGANWNPSSLVVDEVTLVGSRCGRFSEAIEFLQKYKPDLSRLIEREFTLDKALEAFEFSSRQETLKVVLAI